MLRTPLHRRSSLVAVSTFAVPAILAFAGCDAGESGNAAGGKKTRDEADERVDEKLDEKLGEKADEKSAAAAASTPAEKKRRLERIGAAEATKIKKKMRAELDAGRKAVKAGDLDAGIARYEALLEIDPHYGPALGELGWAHFRAGNMTEARTFTTRALAGAKDDKRRGMLLYNLGRVAEKRGENDEAVRLYTASVAARPNDVVQGRLEGLVSGGAKAPPTTTAAPGVPAPFAVIASGLADAQAAHAAAAKDSACGDSFEMAATSTDGKFGVLFVTDDFFGCYHPMVKTDEGWTLFGVMALHQYGSEIAEGADFFEFNTVGSGADAVMVLSYQKSVEERDWESQMDALDSDDPDDYPPLADTGFNANIYCTVAGDQPACSASLLTRYRHDPGDGSTPIEYEAELSINGSDLVVANVKKKGALASADDLWKKNQETVGFDIEAWLEVGTYPLEKLWARD